MFFRMVYKSGQIFLPFCHNPRVWRTYRRTDRILIARPRLHCMQRGKKEARLYRPVMGQFDVSDVRRAKRINETERLEMLYVRQSTLKHTSLLNL